MTPFQRPQEVSLVLPNVESCKFFVSLCPNCDKLYIHDCQTLLDTQVLHVDQLSFFSVIELGSQ